MLKMTMGGVLPRLPTLGAGAAVLGADPTNAQPEGDLGQLLAMYKRAEAERERGETMGAAKYIDNSGGVGVLAAIAQAAMGRHVRRKADETAEQLTGRILTAQQEAKQREATAAALAEEQGIIRKATTEKKLRTQTADELGLSGDARTRFIATGSLPSERGFDGTWDSARGLWIPKPGSGAAGPLSADGGPAPSHAPTTGGGGAMLDAAVPQAPEQLRAIITEAAQRHGVPPEHLLALAAQESSFNPNAHNAETGAAGLFQYIPTTAKARGINPLDPAQAADAAAADWAARLQAGGVAEAAASHFAGPGGGNRGPKTRQYVADMERRIAAYGGQGGEGGGGGMGGLQGIPVAGVAPLPKEAPDWQQRIDYRMQTLGEDKATATRAVMGDSTGGGDGKSASSGASAGLIKDVKQKLAETSEAIDVFRQFNDDLKAIGKRDQIMDPSAAGRLSTSYNSARSALRLLYGTGVLQPGEIPMLEAALKDPTGAAALANPRTRATIDGQLQSLFKMAEQKIKRNVSLYPEVFDQPTFNTGLEQRAAAHGHAAEHSAQSGAAGQPLTPAEQAELQQLRARFGRK